MAQLTGAAEVFNTTAHKQSSQRHMQILVLHGPNLNLLGTREPQVYGATTLEQINTGLTALAAQRGASLSAFQSNHEGAIADRIQAARGRVDGIDVVGIGAVA